MQPAVLVTGAAKRIGATIARVFGEAGWHVVIHHSHSRDAAEALAAQLPSAECIACDLTDGDTAVAMIRELAGRLGDWRVLINSAAVFREDTIEMLDAVIFTEAMAVNAAAPVRMAQAFLAHARANGGRRVIELTDQKLANPNPDFLSYTMAKHAFAATVRLMAMAADDPADRVYGLAPGAMLPSFDQQPEEHQKSGRMNLLQRLTDPRELAEAALFLAGGWLASGETLFVDSGQHLLSQPRDVPLSGARMIEVFLASVATGATLGMMIANAPAVFLAERLVGRVSLKVTRIAAALLLLVPGPWEPAWLGGHL